MLGERDCLVLERSLYYICLYDDFGGDGCAGTATLRTDAVYETILGTGTGWGARTGYFGVGSNCNVG